MIYINIKNILKRYDYDIDMSFLFLIFLGIKVKFIHRIIGYRDKAKNIEFLIKLTPLYF